MSRDSSPDEMRPEYDIRGGVRGKYLERYREGALLSITFKTSSLIVESTASAPPIDSVTRPASYPAPLPSPRIEIGKPLPIAPVPAG